MDTANHTVVGSDVSDCAVTRTQI